MLRRLFLLFPAVFASIGKGQTYERAEIERWVEFHHVWYKFLAAFFGCPNELREFTIDECKRAKDNLDWKLWNQARELAKKIFELEEKRG